MKKKNIPNRNPVRYISSVEDANAWVEEERRRDRIREHVFAVIFSLFIAFAVSAFGPFGPDWLPRLF